MSGLRHVSITTGWGGDNIPIFDEEYKQKLIERLEQRKAAGKLPAIYRLDPDTGLPATISPEQRIKGAREGTPLGNEELFAEYEFMEELKRRKPR